MRISKADKAKKEVKIKALRFYNITVNAAREEYYLTWQRVQETREEQNAEEYFEMLQPALNIYNDKKAAANKQYLEEVGDDANCNF